MSAPSAMTRDRDEFDREWEDVFRRMGSPPSFPEQDPAAQGLLGEAGLDASLSAGSGDSGERSDPPPIPPQAAVRSDDLERLEASLRWLQRQERATRSARSQLPFPPLSPFDAPGAGDDERSNLPMPRSLEPERLAPPPPSQRSWQVPAAVALGCAIAAAIGYLISAGGFSSEPSVPASVREASAPAQVATAWMPKQERESRLIEARDDDVPASAQGEASSIPQRVQPSEPPPAAAAAPPAAAAEPAPAPVTAAAPPTQAIPKEAPPPNPIRAMEAGEIELLMRRAQEFIATGDLVTARILFQRAAQGGDAGAAVALGATYDPIVLARLGVVGISPDVEKARSWYRMAESLGSSEATRRLAGLADR